MILVRRKDLLSSQAMSRSFDKYRLIEGALAQKYLGSKSVNSEVSFELVARLLDDEFEGKTILDLGCGSTQSPDYSPTSINGMYSPWLSRALYETGARVVGIDGADSPGELFEHHRANLLGLNPLAMLNDQSVDVACAFSLFDSPALRSYGGDGDILFNHLLPHLDRVVKKDGFFLFDSFGTAYSDDIHYRTMLDDKGYLSSFFKSRHN